MALPRVLAGPIVRRVESRRCSFWVALSQSATVKVLIWKGEKPTPPADSDRVGEGQQATLQIGAALHVAVVTVDLTAAPNPLVPGDTYSYDMRFTFAGGTTSDLRDERLLQDETTTSRIDGVDPMAPLHLALGFVKDRLPTFLAPPSKFAPTSPESIGAGLRLAHCSCRRPGAGTFDALAGLAPVVRDAAQRPHQLYLTGDQIYADDISTPFLPLVIDLGRELMAGAQPLPGFPPDPRTGGTGSSPVTGAGLPGDRANLPPLRRRWLLWQLAAFTGGDAENHLITFPEFVAHYLLAWSPRVWRALPAFADVFRRPGVSGSPAPAAAIAPWLNRPWFCGAGVDTAQPEETLQRKWSDPAVNVGAFGAFNRAVHHVARYAGATPFVAQVLANTPTSMIFDDHEVADDWNLNGRWVTKVHSREWGRYVVRNGTLAYALMQGWGNDPAAFATDQPGGKLLAAVPDVVRTTAPVPAKVRDVDVLLGLDPPTSAIPKRVSWNYAPSATDTFDYRVVVLDTRTRRDVNDFSLRPPRLIVDLDAQLPARSSAAAEQLLVVVSAAPVLGPAVLEQLGQPLAVQITDFQHRTSVGDVPGFAPGDAEDRLRRAGCGDRSSRGAEKFDLEGWSASEAGFEAMLARLATYPSVVVLSGDVHYAATLSLDYWAKGRAQPSRLVQCTSSPAKNVFKEEVEAVIRQVGNLQRAQEVPAERLAWNAITVSDLVPAGARLSLARRSRISRQPALLPSAPWPAGAKIPTGKQPDWRWRMQPVIDTTTTRAQLPDTLEPDPIATGNDARPEAARLAEIAATHQTRTIQGTPMLRRLVFAPNFGTVRFEVSAARTIVVNRLHTPTTVVTFPLSESQPRPAGRPGDPQMAFGPHTVHRVDLRTPPDAQPPTIVAGA